MTHTLFFTTTIIAATKQLMREGLLAQITTPSQGNVVPGVVWGADNECFLGKYRGDDPYIAWLRKQSQHAQLCRFANAPDVVGDWAATADMLQPMAGRIRELGLPAALCAQNGMEASGWDKWDEIDALFIGGSDEFKLGPGGRQMAAEAKAHGKWVHMGRVNSLKRYRYAHAIGCDSADGTVLAFQPDRNIPRMREWVNALDQMPLEGVDLDDVGRDGSALDGSFRPNTASTVASVRKQAAERAIEREEEAAEYAQLQPALFGEQEQVPAGDLQLAELAAVELDAELSTTDIAVADDQPDLFSGE